MSVQTSAARVTWTVVLRPDGVVDDVVGAPATWLGHSIREHPEVADALRQAATTLLARRDDRAWVQHSRVPLAVAGADVDVDLIVCSAVPVRRTHVIVRNLVLRVLDLFRLQAPNAGIEIQLEYSHGVPVSFVADGEKLVWAMSVLVGNAIRYLQHSEKKQRRITIVVDYEFETDELVIRVGDNGPGLSPQRQRWLFDRDPETGRSAGLSLVMVKDIVVAHRGSIEVDGRPGVGLAFTLRLPGIAIGSAEA